MTSSPTGASAELVTVLDDEGRPYGIATRARVRAENLLHGATAVLVRDSADRVYVHRRTDTKDIYPGAYDCWAGGVLTAGEEPVAGAVRELAEELGIKGVPLQPLFTTRWRDATVQAIYHAFAVRWDGPITHQVDEVAWGGWWSLDELARSLTDGLLTFAPDGRHLLAIAGIMTGDLPLSRSAD
ncbi:MAG TPA: NUDIX domain-containing protein [Acidothermaceae bacterium]